MDQCDRGPALVARIQAKLAEQDPAPEQPLTREGLEFISPPVAKSARDVSPWLAILRSRASHVTQQISTGFIPLLYKQMPFPIGQFTVHEEAVEAIYHVLGPERRSRLTQIESTGVE